MIKPENSWVKIAMTENINEGLKSEYTKYVQYWKTKTNCFGLSLAQTKKQINHTAVIDVLKKRQSSSTTAFALSVPHNSFTSSWFKPKPWVSDSGISKIYAQFRASNSGLGNRGPAVNGQFYKMCPLCHKNGIKALNNEVRYLINS